MNLSLLVIWCVMFFIRDQFFVKTKLALTQNMTKYVSCMNSFLEEHVGLTYYFPSIIKYSIVNVLKAANEKL